MPLTRADVRSALRLSVLDGVAYAVMVGLADAYFIADAIRLAATPLQLALVVCLPLAVGALGPLLALHRLGRGSRRRPLVVAAALCQALLLIGLALADGSGRSSPELLIAFVSLHQVCGQCAGTAWSSWYGDLVPAAIRGPYFAHRNRVVHLSSFGGLIAGGLLLEWIQPGPVGASARQGGLGFAAVFGLAGSFRLVSAALLAASPEARFQGLSAPRRMLRFLATRGGSRLRRLLLGVALLQLAVYVSAPYFGPRMLEDLSFTYVEYMAAIGAMVAAKVLLLPAWGRAVDHHGALATITLAAVLIALLPLPWILVGSLAWVLALEAYSGACWAGFEIAQFALLLEVGHRGVRPYAFAAHSLAIGASQLAGGLLGAWIVAASGDLRVVFAVSLAGRLAAALSLPRLLPAPAGEPRVRRRDVLLRLVGFRPTGGAVHRPVFVSEPREAPAPEE